MTGKLLYWVGLAVIILGVGWIALGPNDDDIQNYAPATVVSGVVFFCTGLILSRIDQRTDR